MSQRYNETNNGGIVTIAGGNMPADNYTNKYQPTSRTSGQGGQGGAASIVVIANSHPVEVAGDGGLWDTTSGVAVQDFQTNILCIGT
jgi:hypothetical protein